MRHIATFTITTFALTLIGCEADLAVEELRGLGDPSSTHACSNPEGDNVYLMDPLDECDEGDKHVCDAGEYSPGSTQVCCNRLGEDCELVEPPDACNSGGKHICDANNG